jgi:hypothetical protein
MYSAFVSAASIGITLYAQLKKCRINRILSGIRKGMMKNQLGLHSERALNQSNFLSFISIHCVLSNNLLMLDKMNTIRENIENAFVFIAIIAGDCLKKGERS